MCHKNVFKDREPLKKYTHVPRLGSLLKYCKLGMDQNTRVLHNPKEKWKCSP